MNYKLLMAVMTVLSQLMIALADGKLTGDEMMNILTGLMKTFGIPVGAGDLFTFEAVDGGIYIKIGGDLLKKISVNIPME